MKQPLFLKMARFFLVILCFTLDIKVRANENLISVIDQSGYLEIDKNEDSSIDIETFKKANLKLSQGSTFVGLKEKTFVTIEKDTIQLHFGSVFIRTKVGEKFNLNSRQSVVKSSEAAEFTVTSFENKTLLSVISGNVILATRTNDIENKISAGFTAWIGGIEINGKRAEGKADALDLNECMDDLKLVGGINEKELPVALDHLRIVWRAAVDQVAQNAQTDVNKNMKTVDHWLIERHKKNLKDEKMRLQVKEYFRAHALDLPYQNKEFPSESPRSPSSAD